MMPQVSVLLVGASVRAAAFSALRRGWRPWCADLFGDADLRLRCPVRVIPSKDYPKQIPRIIADEAPDGVLQYTGGLENHPRIVAQLARLRPLWGNGPNVLRAVRNPLRLAEVLAGYGLPVTINLADVPRDGSWLAKPLRGCGGKGIHPVTLTTRPRRGWYYQQFQAGESISAGFLADGAQGCRLLGATRQLVGEAWLHTRAFAYCGSIGPLALTREETEALTDIGRRLQAAFGLVGYFGVDAIRSPNGQIRVVEVNPRYTASIEVLEYAAGGSARQNDSAQMIGKAIVFADRPAGFPEDGPWQRDLASGLAADQLPDYADIPLPGTPIEPGQPILTLFVRGDSEAECYSRLRQKAAMLDELLLGGKMLDRPDHAKTHHNPTE
jgi:predicted ATP-grasp superfamily ATP-dependent carboligase